MWREAWGRAVSRFFRLITPRPAIELPPVVIPAPTDEEMEEK